MKLLRPTIQSIIFERPVPTEEQPQGMCLDKGYDYNEVRDILREFGFTDHIRPRGEEAKAIKRQAGFKARRGVLAFLHFACGLIAFAPPGYSDRLLATKRQNNQKHAHQLQKAVVFH